MIFTTIDFVLFFAVFLLVHGVLPPRWRRVWLLSASYFFYGSWNPKFLVLLFASTLVDFYVGREIHGSEDEDRRRRLVQLSIGFNLGLLGIFKYFNFFIESAMSTLAMLGIEASPPLIHVVLPVGISFYTFQSMSYTIDIYRRRFVPTDSFLEFATFVSLFPQLVAGPIERASHLMPQLSRVTEGFKRADLSGIPLIALGVFKKAVIADNLAYYADATFLDPASTHSPAMLIGTYAVTLQVYCDFSGYCDIAVGVARLLGIQLMQNFRAPFASAGPGELWVRWHVSLSTWLRDYLYIPLGGNRGGEFKQRRNLMLTMLLGGLWHGAAWNFVLWGGFHGLLLLIFRGNAWERLRKTLEGDSRVRTNVVTAIRRIGFFHLFVFGGAMFRATSLEHLRIILWKIISFPTWDIEAWLDAVAISGEGPVLIALSCAIAYLVGCQMVWPVGSFEMIERFQRLPASVRYATISIFLYMAVIFSPLDAEPFVYFAF